MDYTELEAAGINVEQFLARLMNNDRLVKMLVGKFVADTNYASLVSSIDAGDMQAASGYTHTLKGMSGNMSLDELFALTSEQMAAFRAEEYGRAIELMSKITPAYTRAVEHMNLWLSKN